MRSGQYSYFKLKAVARSLEARKHVSQDSKFRVSNNRPAVATAKKLLLMNFLECVKQRRCAAMSLFGGTSRSPCALFTSGAAERRSIPTLVRAPILIQAIYP
jgi:hypothetical protein